jgi:hypothetical protein
MVTCTIRLSAYEPGDGMKTGGANVEPLTVIKIDELMVWPAAFAA